MKWMTTACLGVLAVVLAGPAARAESCLGPDYQPRTRQPGNRLFDCPAIDRAHQALAGNPQVVVYCEPCGDTAPGEPFRIDTLDEFDLAYLYVQTSEHEYRNLAVLAGCGTSGVSPSLRVDRVTATGVMIVPEAGATAAVASSEQTVRSTEAPAAGRLDGALSAVFLLLAALVFRFVACRRTRHVPRAAQLDRPET